AWALALTGDGLGPALRRLFSRCLREGRFPEPWRTGRLVLIPKEGRPRDEPNGYRPIVVLDEAGKLFERVIANRLVQHLENVGPDLAPNQYGFRRGRSTVDAVLRVRHLSDCACSEGGVLLAVSIDIANAFNTIPWSPIMESLRFHRVPTGLRNLIEDYLSGRAVIFPERSGWGRKTVSRGVPQGSVL
ncbi:reverse transcriptase family protein, partial [Pseudomonas aeruginosa]